MGLFDDHLSFISPSGASALPPRGSHLLVSDTLTASANVVLFHLIMSAVQAGVPIVWVDFRSETLASFDTVLRRLGAPLPKPPRFTYLSPFPLPPSLLPCSSSAPSEHTPPLFTPAPTLAPTLAAIRQALAHTLPPGGARPSPSSALPSSDHHGATSARSLVLLDGLSELSGLGFAPAEITRFVRATLADLRGQDGALVSTVHLDTEQEGEEGWELLRRLLRLGGSWWRVSGLVPRSGEVSGEISAVAFDGAGPAVARDKAIQYRLEPAGVKAFPKGTGRGYL